ncbi:MAG: glycosyltransferase family 4 protein [Kosmotogaceae bacterium]
MKILILHSVPIKGSGSGTYVQNLSLNLSKKHDVLVLYPGPINEESYPVKNITITPVPVFTSHPIVDSISMIDLDNEALIETISIYFHEFKNVLEDFSPDIIHVQHFGLWLLIASVYKRLANIPVLVTAHGTGLHVLENDERFLKLYSDVTDSMDRIVAVSDGVKSRIIRSFPDLEGKIDIVMGGVDLKKFDRPNITKTEWKKKYKLEDEVVLFAGRIIKEKGIQHLVNVAEYFPNTSIVIAGSGDYKKTIEKLSKNKKNVILLPHLDEEIVDFFVHSDLLCVPSIWEEALGLVILEAMAARTPVLASNIGGIPSVVENYKTGILFEPGNENDLKEKIDLLLKDTTLSKTLASNAYEVVKNNFTWNSIAEKIEALYVQLCDQYEIY